MKQIKYGNRSKSKSTNLVQSIKQGEDDICGDVLDSLNPDYLTYISDLVKASKTPSKKNCKQVTTQQKVNKFFDSPKQTSNLTFQGKRHQISQSPITEKSFKNSTIPLKKFKRESLNSQQPKKIQKGNQSIDKHIKHELIKDRCNRFPTQQAQRHNYDQKRYQETSILCSQSEQNKYNDHNKGFILGIDEYLLNLESSRNMNSQNYKNKRKDNIRDMEQIMHENLKLRKKVHKYEQKIEQIQQNLETHFIQCKNKEKTQKKKINELIKSLAQAVNKINQQKQQIDSMKQLFKAIGKKAHHCAIQYEQNEDSGSEAQVQINETLIKAMKPSRAHSQNKLNKKRDLDVFLLGKNQPF